MSCVQHLRFCDLFSFLLLFLCFTFFFIHVILVHDIPFFSSPCYCYGDTSKSLISSGSFFLFVEIFSPVYRDITTYYATNDDTYATLMKMKENEVPIGGNNSPFVYLSCFILCLLSVVCLEMELSS